MIYFHASEDVPFDTRRRHLPSPPLQHIVTTHQPSARGHGGVCVRTVFRTHLPLLPFPLRDLGDPRRGGGTCRELPVDTQLPPDGAAQDEIATN